LKARIDGDQSNYEKLQMKVSANCCKSIKKGLSEKAALSIWDLGFGIED
jgi:ribosomal protein L28